MSGHRALPLDEVEARARAAREPWPNGVPPGVAKAMADDWEEIARPLAHHFKPVPPPYPWRALGSGLLVLLVTCGAVHLLARLGAS